MKKIFFAFAALVLSFTGCGLEDGNTQANENKAVKVVVNMEKPGFGNETRAARRSWEDGDEVVVTLDNLLAEYCLKLTYDGTSKTWTTIVMEPNMRTGEFFEGSISKLSYTLLGDETEVSGLARAAYFSSGVAQIVYGQLSSIISTRASLTYGLIINTYASQGCSWKGDTPNISDKFGECIMTCIEGGYTLKETEDDFELTLDITLEPMVAQFTIRDLKAEDDWSITTEAPMNFAAGGYFTERTFYPFQIEYQRLGYKHQNGNDISIYAVPWRSNYDIPSYMLPDGVDIDALDENFYTSCPYVFRIYDSGWNHEFQRDFGTKEVVMPGNAVILDGPFTKGPDGEPTLGAQAWVDLNSSTEGTSY